MRWDSDKDVLEVIFGESKLWSSFSSALADAFESIEAFHVSKAKPIEVGYFTNEFSVLDEPLKSQVLSYVDGENVNQYREVHACLIGHDWNEYKCLDDERRASFVAEFNARYLKWAKNHMHPLLEKHITTFKQKHLRLEFWPRQQNLWVVSGSGNRPRV
jgi:hypothetical protein